MRDSVWRLREVWGGGEVFGGEGMWKEVQQQEVGEGMSGGRCEAWEEVGDVGNVRRWSEVK